MRFETIVLKKNKNDVAKTSSSQVTFSIERLKLIRIQKVDSLM